MSENEDLSYQVEVKLNNADRQLNKLTDSFAAVVASGTAADSTMDRLEKQTVKVSAAVSAATLALRAQSKELKGISQYTTAMQAYATATESAAKAAARFKSNTNLKGFSVFGKAQQASVAAQVPDHE